MKESLLNNLPWKENYMIEILVYQCLKIQEFHVVINKGLYITFLKNSTENSECTFLKWLLKQLQNQAN